MARRGVVWARCGVAAAAIAGSALLPACGDRVSRDDIRDTIDKGKTSGGGEAKPPQGGGGKPPQGGGTQPTAACPPLTVTDDLRGVFAVAANDVWAVGDAGTVLHYDGCWRAEPKATTADLNGVWASADGTVWVAGASATTLRRSGGAWSVFTAPGAMDVQGIWATATDVWAAAANQTTQEGAIFRWDGAAWQLSHTNSTPGTYSAIWAAAPDDVWVVGDGREPDTDYTAIHVHWDGAAWTESYSCNPEGSRFAAGGWVAVLADIWGISANAVWDAGDCSPGAGPVRHALIERRAGDAWLEIDPGVVADYRPLGAIWASSESDLWGASAAENIEGNIPTMLHFDGTAWTASDDPNTVGIHDLGGTSASDVWAVGLRGKRLHFDGTAWTPSP